MMKMLIKENVDFFSNLNIIRLGGFKEVNRGILLFNLSLLRLLRL